MYAVWCIWKYFICAQDEPLFSCLQRVNSKSYDIIPHQLAIIAGVIYCDKLFWSCFTECNWPGMQAFVWKWLAQGRNISAILAAADITIETVKWTSAIWIDGVIVEEPGIAPFGFIQNWFDLYFMRHSMNLEQRLPFMSKFKQMMPSPGGEIYF